MRLPLEGSQPSSKCHWSSALTRACSFSWSSFAAQLGLSKYVAGRGFRPLPPFVGSRRAAARTDRGQLVLHRKFYRLPVIDIGTECPHIANARTIITALDVVLLLLDVAPNLIDLDVLRGEVAQMRVHQWGTTRPDLHHETHNCVSVRIGQPLGERIELPSISQLMTWVRRLSDRRFITRLPCNLICMQYN